MRGEKAEGQGFGVHPLGSPPHARGKVLLDRLTFDNARITPACAGKRPFLQAPLNNPRDHPRMRGEKKHMQNHPHHAPGSPPHARGKAHRGRDPRGQEGITPACAGKSF